MRIHALMFCLLLLMAAPAIAQQASQRVRPYSGIGVLFLAAENDGRDGRQEPLYLYEEPAVQRIGTLDGGQAPPYEWLFTQNDSRLPLIVMARKGDWLRVAYDDAGRLGWVNAGQRGDFQSWDTLLKGRSCRLLPGLRSRYYQIFRQPGTMPVTLPGLSKRSFKVVKMDGDWVLAMPDQSLLGWLRWRDQDGRLLIFVDMGSGPQKR